MNVFQSVLVLALIQMLVGCATVSPWYEGEQKDTVSVTWKRVADVDKVCREFPVATDKKILGCSRVEGNDCIIYTPVPKEVDDNDTTTVGHEVMHCFNYNHKNNNL